MTALVLRHARAAERGELEALQLRASLMWEEYGEALLAHADAVQIPLGEIEERRVIVAERDGAVIGFAVVLPLDDGDCEFDGLFVEPSAWRTGVGTRLVSESSVMAAAGGATALHVVTSPRALGFYTRCGFATTGDEPTRFGVGIRMRRAIGPVPARG